MLVSNGDAVRVTFQDNQTLFLDATFRCKNGVVGVSHGHSDHLRKHTARTITTRETSELFPSYFESAGLQYGHKENVHSAEVSMHDAGHVLGSAQFRIEADGCVLAYSGDMKSSPSILFSGAEQLECDTLILEATFGSPEYVFPPTADVADSIRTWVSTHASSNIVFGAYPLGKTQELVSILNGINIRPIVSQKAAHFCRVYNQNGFKQDFTEAGTPETLREHAFVEIVPPSLLHDTAYLAKKANKKRTLTSLATGWASTFASANCDRAFPLSAHSDFNELVSYAERSHAKQVYTIHGFDRELAAHLRKNGVNARALHGSQARISDF